MTKSAQLTELSGSRIVRRPAPFPKAPNDYKGECERFDWADARKLLDGLPNGKGYNIAHEAVDRHAAGLRSGKAANRWLGKSGERRELSYGDLAEATNRFANTLAALGVLPSPLVEEMELLHFTRGTTGRPKGAVQRRWSPTSPASMRSTCTRPSSLRAGRWTFDPSLAWPVTAWRGQECEERPRAQRSNRPPAFVPHRKLRLTGTRYQTGYSSADYAHEAG